jgi:hypothetical protein
VVEFYGFKRGVEVANQFDLRVIGHQTQRIFDFLDDILKWPRRSPRGVETPSRQSGDFLGAEAARGSAASSAFCKIQP